MIEDAQATELGKTLSSFGWVTYLWVGLLSMLGGMANIYRKWKSGHVRAFNFTEFVGELVTSGLAGLITFYMCEAGDIGPEMAAICIAIAGHMGSRFLFLMEETMKKKFHH